MKIAIGSDHAGYELKAILKDHLKEKQINVVDYGTDSLESVDYPDYAEAVGQAVAHDDFDFGILVCGTGIGVSIAANKVKGVRAALIYNEETARLAKQHNQANVITMGGRMTSPELAKKMVDAFMEEHFETRHQRRIDKISKIEEK
ncbi:MAG: ribose 5-phosphate isomerase B [Acholeplasmataceae bacterium]|nr:ribose 5-phosphate isomerase B [Acholeplasmataceae bacterium]